ncbi:MAG: DUF1223 domain-containing protein [Burkholderiales bacterium]|nr:DUF1223 domain-containing protein [Burkholderiales bacterium]
MKKLAAAVRLALIALPAFAAGSAIAQTCSKQSPPHTVALLELYTSEGCDSCPSADRFISGLRQLSRDTKALSGLAPEQVVPLSLHVDYWDYIGWKDVFARREFTERQRWLSALVNSRTVYTPEFFVGGRELRNWRGGLADAVAQINQRPAQANISITLGKQDNGAVPVAVNATARQGGRLFVALYENGISSEVKAGENRGVTLKHDYVVRDWIGPIALSGDAGKPALSRVLQLRPTMPSKNLGVAAFVESEKGEVLQALALPFCPS